MHNTTEINYVYNIFTGDPAVHKRYHKYGNLKDDPAWLPQGPPGTILSIPLFYIV